MPKKETKDNKVNKTTKKVTDKKTTTKKAVEKTSPKKKVEVKKTAPKKNVEVKEETKVLKVTTEKEGIFDRLVERAKENVPFTVAVCIIVLLVATLIFMGCSKRVPKTSDGKEILATLNGKTITADDLYEKLKENNPTDALMSIVDEYITEKEVKVTDEDTEYVNEVVNYYKDYAEYYGVDLASFLSSYVGLQGITTEDEFKDYVLKDYKKTLAVVKFIGDTAKESDLKEYYESNYTDKLTVKHILIEVNEDTNEETALNKAKGLIETLNNTDAKDLDAKFNELAENNSDDTGTYSNGGLLENVSKNDVVEEFWNASVALKDGEYTKDPVKSTYGYHVILRVSSTPADKYEDIKNEVKKAYAQDLLSNDSSLYALKWDELRKQYKLSIKDDIIKETYEKQISNAKNTEEN